MIVGQDGILSRAIAYDPGPAFDFRAKFCIIGVPPTRISKIIFEDLMVRRCPLCRRETIWEDNPWKPFCCERCQMFDLGRWSAEEYGVPLHETPEGLPEGLINDFDRQLSSDEQT